MECDDVLFLAGGEPGLFAAEFSLGLGNLHAFAGTDEVGFEFGDRGQGIEEAFAGGVGGVVNGSSEAELDVACVGKEAVEPVEFRDLEGVAGAVGGEGLLKFGSFAVPSGESVSDVDQAIRVVDELEVWVTAGGLTQRLWCGSRHREDSVVSFPLGGLSLVVIE